MTELEKMQWAKIYVDKMANGINPITDAQIRADDCLNDVHISRCLFYISDVLEKVIDNGGIVALSKSSKKSKAKSLPFDPELLRSYSFSDESLTLSNIAANINSLSENPNMKKIAYKDLAPVLIEKGFLDEIVLPTGKKTKVPTQDGLDRGMTVIRKNGADGNVYDVIVYDQKAQQMVIKLFYNSLIKTIEK